MTVLPMIDQQIRSGGEGSFNSQPQLQVNSPVAPPWWKDELDIPNGQIVTRKLIDSHFKELAKLRHPDHGGSEEDFRKLVQAREAARMEVL